MVLQPAAAWLLRPVALSCPAVILCDYCDDPAKHWVNRGSRLHRSFACVAHFRRAREAFAGGWVDPPIADRPRHVEMDREQVEAALTA